MVVGEQGNDDRYGSPSSGDGRCTCGRSGGPPPKITIVLGVVVAAVLMAAQKHVVQ